MWGFFQEAEAQTEIIRRQHEVDELSKALEDKIKQLSRCETVIENLTTELSNSQEDLHKAFDKIEQLERTLVDYKEQVAVSRQEVGIALLE